MDEDKVERELRQLLRTDPQNERRLLSRESTRLEYKESFNWNDKSRYARTLAAFANSRGGHIVFGVKNSPRELVGVRIDRFEGLDPATAANYFSSVLAPELVWSQSTFGIAGIRLGVLSVEFAGKKPVVCVKNDGHLKEAEVYYRYRGRTERIKYPELGTILDEREQAERARWLRHLQHVSQVGLENVGILDLERGELSGEHGRLLISEDLLEKVKFIQQGRFEETDEAAAPTLRVVGDVEAVQPLAYGRIRHVATPVALGEKEIMLTFLRHQRPHQPQTYLLQACREVSGYLPIYYFARLAQMPREELVEFARAEARRVQVRERLVRRINGAKIAAVGALAGTPEADERAGMLEAIREGRIDPLRGAPRNRLFEAISHYVPEELPNELSNFLADLVQAELNQLTVVERSLLRKSVSLLDEQHYSYD